MISAVVPSVYLLSASPLQVVASSVLRSCIGFCGVAAYTLSSGCLKQMPEMIKSAVLFPSLMSFAIRLPFIFLHRFMSFSLIMSFAFSMSYAKFKEVCDDISEHGFDAQCLVKAVLSMVLFISVLFANLFGLTGLSYVAFLSELILTVLLFINASDDFNCDFINKYGEVLTDGDCPIIEPFIPGVVTERAS